MRPTTAIRLAASLAALAALAAPGGAAPPRKPLPQPPFSLDAGSPELGPAGARAYDLLVRDPLDGIANVAISGAGLGLRFPAADDLDAFSCNRRDPAGIGRFSLLFSVDRDTIGLALPDPNFVAQGLPYNATDQAARGHAAADVYMSTRTFGLGATLTTESSGGGLAGGNNVPVFNQFDEGGTSFDLEPEGSSEDVDPNDASDDDADCVACTSDPNAAAPPPGAYYSLRTGSPTLASSGFPGASNPSGASLFFQLDPQGGGDPLLYAHASTLGLAAADDIDALLVIDNGTRGVFDAGDAVLFSLAPGSPSLTQIPGASAVGAAADIFIRRPGTPIGVLASAAQLGLGAVPDRDNIDALDIRRCGRGRACARRHGIRRLAADCDDDGVIGPADAVCLVDCWSGPGNSYDLDGTQTAVVFATSELTPRNVFVEVGDLVRWTWLCGVGNHRIRSGYPGLPDGAFDSAGACPFSRGFGETFLAAHPRAANVYPYFDANTGATGQVMALPDPCALFDADQDGDVDLHDARDFQLRYGP